MDKIEERFVIEPKVSVIVPVYKVDRYLVQCIQSIIDQTLENIEIIIVDEGDLDGCRKIIDYYESIDSRIIAPHKKNGGYGASCNLGFELARGEYIAIVESDDFIESTMYEKLYEYAKLLDADVVKSPYYEYFNDGTIHDCYYRKKMQVSTPENCCFSVKEFDDLMRVHASVWSGLYRRSYMEENGIRFVEKGAYVDVGFRIETLINTKKIAWLDQPFYYYRMDNPGSTTNNFNISAMIDRWNRAHKYLSNYKDDYNKYYGAKLFMDEYVNEIERYWETSISKEQTVKISENLSFISDELIDKLDELTPKKKKELRLLKKSPRNYYKKYSIRNYLIRINHKYGISNYLRGCFSVESLLYALVTFVSCYYAYHEFDEMVLINIIVQPFMYLSFAALGVCVIGKAGIKILQKALILFSKNYGKHI